MALSDYRLCDVCSCKTFYDATLEYNLPPKDHPLYPEYLPSERVGAWAVICIDCAKTHRVVIEKICVGVGGGKE